MGGKGGGSTTVKPEIPKELKPLIDAAVEQALAMQAKLPLSSFASYNPQYVPGLSDQQMGLINQIIGFSQQPMPWQRTTPVATGQQGGAAPGVLPIPARTIDGMGLSVGGVPPHGVAAVPTQLSALLPHLQQLIDAARKSAGQG